MITDTITKPHLKLLSICSSPFQPTSHIKVLPFAIVARNAYSFRNLILVCAGSTTKCSTVVSFHLARLAYKFSSTIQALCNVSKPVNFTMLSWRNYLKIRYSIIKTIEILMMNMLVTLKFSAKMLFHYISMILGILTVYYHSIVIRSSFVSKNILFANSNMEVHI